MFKRGTLVVCNWDKRVRPLVLTPAKGTIGDITDESCAEDCEVASILRKYSGNLAVLAGWQKEGTYGDQPIRNLEDAFEALRLAKDRFVNESGKWPFRTLEEVFNAMDDGSFLSKVQDFNNDLVEQDKKARLARLREDGRAFLGKSDTENKEVLNEEK